MHDRLFNSAVKLMGASRANASVMTNIRDVEQHSVLPFKKNEFGREIGLYLPEIANQGIQTDELETLLSEMSAEKSKERQSQNSFEVDPLLQKKATIRRK